MRERDPKRRLAVLKVPFVEKFADLNHLTDLTADLKLDDFEGLDGTALTEFRGALRRRAEGKPDDDWQSRIVEPD